MEKLLNDLLNPAKNFDDDIQKLKSFSAKIDITENETSFFILLSVPGFDKKDISISVEKNSLNVKGNRELKGEKEAFENKFSLPNIINTNTINATTENGILTIELPKAPEQKLKIEIQ